MSADLLDQWLSVAYRDAEGCGVIETNEMLARLRRNLFAAEDAHWSVGRYRDVVRIGRGGMGVVYRAHDTELDRPVALKVLRRDRLTDPARLRAEARAMAALSHPNIVEVLGVGELAGEQFVVMELVDGVDAAHWLEQAPRSAEEILAVFTAAGAGLAAAHAAGIVHRDFKPSNVLVGTDGRTRVTDFGLAGTGNETRGAVPPPNHDNGGAPTPTSAQWGTPRYMAPEQLDGRRVTPAVDQWALARSIEEALRSSGFGRQRHVPSAVRRVLERALAHDPAHRFDSMRQLVSALRRATDRPRKTARWTAVVAVAATGAVLAAFAAAPGGPDCDPASMLAQRWGERKPTEIDQAFARTELSFASRASQDVRTEIDAWGKRWVAAYESSCKTDTVTRPQQRCLRTQLAELDAQLDVLADADAEVVARGWTVRHGLPDPAGCERADDEQTPIDSESVMRVYADLARVRARSSVGRYDEARDLAKRAVKRASMLGMWLPLAWAEFELGVNRWRGGAFKSAAPPLERAYYAAAAHHHPELAGRAALMLTGLESAQANYDAAQTWVRHAVTWVGRVDDNERLGIELLVTRAELAADRGHEDESLALLDEAWRSFDGDEAAPWAERVLNQKAIVLRDRGDYDQARRHFERVIEIGTRLRGSGHPVVAHGWTNLGTVYYERGDYADAAEAFGRGLEIHREVYGPAHPNTANDVMNLGVVAAAQQRLDDALDQFSRAYATLVDALGPDHPKAVAAHKNRAATLWQLGRYEEAANAQSRILDALGRTYGSEHTMVADAHLDLSSSLVRLGRRQEAIEHVETALAIIEQRRGDDHPSYAAALHTLAALRVQADDHAGALTLDRRALDILERSRGVDHERTGEVLVGIAANELALGRPRRALDAAKRARTITSMTPRYRGRAAFLAARARWELGGSQRDTVDELLDEARRFFERAAAEGKVPLAELEAWVQRR